MRKSRHPVILLPHEREDRRFEQLTVRPITRTTRLHGGRTTAITFLLRITEDAIQEGAPVKIAVHLNRPLAQAGILKLHELYDSLRAAVERALKTLPKDIPFLRDNIFWITVDVAAGPTSDRHAQVLADFDFDRAEQALAQREKEFREKFGGWFRGLFLWLRSTAFQEERDTALIALIDERARHMDIQAAKTLHTRTAAGALRRTLQEDAGSVLARVFAADASAEEHAEVAGRDCDPGSPTCAVSVEDPRPTINMPPPPESTRAVTAPPGPLDAPDASRIGELVPFPSDRSGRKP